MAISVLCELFCLALSVVFLWSTLVVIVGLVKSERHRPRALRQLRFAIVVCARNEAGVIRLPVKSVLMSHYPDALREVFVIADNCTDDTAELARKAGAKVLEKREPSAGKGDVLAWGLKRILAMGGFDAIAVFDADNIVSEHWLEAVNDALQNGETVVTGRRQASNARANVIAGWYAIYWSMMNELSNRVRTNIGLSGKLTGTGFAFLTSALGPEGWNTRTMVEDVEFTVQSNLAGRRVAYVPQAYYADEQPVTWRYMWRQLRRWATGGWQVVAHYTFKWLGTLVCSPSLRLFDSFFAILTGMSVAFVLLFDVVAFAVRACRSQVTPAGIASFLGVIGFICVMGWITAWTSVALSSQKRRPRALSLVTFPVFSVVLSLAVLAALVWPTRRWKAIPHGGETGTRRKCK